MINIIHLQASRWNSAKIGMFTINLASTSRNLYSIWSGRAFPANPAVATWPVQARIGTLAGETDLWWDVEESTNAETLSDFIVDSFRSRILQWFEMYPSLDALYSGLSTFRKYGDVPGVHEAQVPLIQAIIKHQSGDMAAAERLLAASMLASQATPFAATVSTIASRLKLNIE